MGLILKILGVVFLIVVFVIIIGIFWIRSRIKKFSEEVAKMGDSLDNSSFTTPTRIHLESESKPEYKDPEKIKVLVDDFKENGFEEIGVYKVSEIPGLLLTGFMNTEKSMYGIVYDHPAAGIFVDITLKYQDGISITATNAGFSGQMDAPPENIRIKEEGAPPGRLMKLVLEKIEDKPVISVSKEKFQANFEKAYADEMDWRMARGGPTEEEIRRVASQMGEPITEETLQLVREQYASAAAQQLSEACLDTYLQETNMPASEWEKKRDNALVVHDKFKIEDLACYLIDYDDDDSTEEKLLEGIDTTLATREKFRIASLKVSPEKRPEKIGSVTKPIEADIYLTKD